MFERMDKESFIESPYYKTYDRFAKSLMDIPVDKINEIQENFDTIILKKYENIFYYDTHPSKVIFEFRDNNQFIFKITNEENSIKRYNNFLFAKYICDKFKLDLIKIPNTIIIDMICNGKNVKFTIEEKVDIMDTGQTRTEFEKNPDLLDDTVYQLITFTVNTGFSDIDYRNIPIIKEDYKNDGNIKKRIALIDLEDMDSVTIGLFGKPRVRGLLKCIGNKKQWKMIKDQCIESKINIDDYEYEFNDALNHLNI